MLFGLEMEINFLKFSCYLYIKKFTKISRIEKVVVNVKAIVVV